MPSNLARTLPLTIQGRELKVSTPLLVPSFSSKAGNDLNEIFEALKLSITESFLVSAYDVRYKRIAIPNNALAEVMFLDSGGYEVTKDFDVTDPYYPSPEPRPWTKDQYRDILEKVDPIMPTFVTSFDHPLERQSASQQVDAAIAVFKDFPGLGREILFKPEEEGQAYIPIPSLTAQVSRFSEFDIVGMTETELGGSVLERMANISRVRTAMDVNGVTKPLHIFGSLDPVCTPLYFLAGADIFDGLSWIRFSYQNDIAVYHKNHTPLQFGIVDSDRLSRFRSLDANLHYLSELKGRLRRYLLDMDEKRLGPHGDFFAKSLDDLRVVLRGVV